MTPSSVRTSFLALILLVALPVAVAAVAVLPALAQDEADLESYFAATGRTPTWPSGRSACRK
jgi:hypothetical protein